MTLEEELRDCLMYDPETGDLWWKYATNIRKIDKPAGTKTKDGYRKITYLFEGKRRNLLSHRVAWLLYYGDWPNGPLDHIDRVKDNNKISNLREVSSQQNTWNTSYGKNNTTGYKGVSYYEKDSTYVARGWFGGENKYLGSFKTAKEAGKAYDKAVEKYRDQLAFKNGE